jgi:hypothetical protein
MYNGDDSSVGDDHNHRNKIFRILVVCNTHTVTVNLLCLIMQIFYHGQYFVTVSLRVCSQHHSIDTGPRVIPYSSEA